MRQFITQAFMKRIGRDGALAEAASRLAPVGSYAPLPKFSTWELVCEEVVDTEYSSEYYERVLAELYRRGLAPKEVTAMRMFAWETAGWLNFERMLWDWCSLNEADIELAIVWQLEGGEISARKADKMREYLRRYAKKD
ncbi:hypothetical protein [Lacipirellula sp.]|uniref:hypothetical protein n=1 Tax=Lacipirellula sp. TaxID=2691419 RepID=UPI003D0A7890